MGRSVRMGEMPSLVHEVAARNDLGVSTPTSSDDDSEWLTVVEAAATAGVSPSTLKRWLRDGRIPSEVTADGRRVIRRRELAKRVVKMDRPVPREE